MVFGSTRATLVRKTLGFTVRVIVCAALTLSLPITALTACGTSLKANYAEAKEDFERISVSTPVRVTKTDDGSYFWLVLAEGESQDSPVVVCGIRNRPNLSQPLQTVAHVSSDDGQTWSTSIVDDAGYFSSEVECAVAPDDTLVFSSARSQYFWDAATASHSRATESSLFTSNDHGKTWSESKIDKYLDSAQVVFLSSGEDGDQRQFVMFNGRSEERFIEREILEYSVTQNKLIEIGSFDSTPGIPKKGIKWLGDASAIGPSAVGAVWVEPKTFVTREETDFPEFDDNVLELLDVERSYITYGAYNLSRSDETNLAVVAPLSNAYNQFLADTPNNGFYVHRWPSLAAGEVPAANINRIYVTWHDYSQNRMRVFVSYSDDNGLSWAPARAIDDSGRRVEDRNGDLGAARPSIAVDQSGVVAIQWGEKGGACWRVSLSFDGGATFGPSVALNQCNSILQITHGVSGKNLLNGARNPANRNNTVTIGLRDSRRRWELSKNTGIVARPGGGFRSAWISTQNSATYSIYTSIIDYDLSQRPKCQFKPFNGSFGGSDSRGLRFEYGELDFDPMNGVFEIYVVPVSDNSFEHDSVSLRLSSLTSELGDLHVVNSDNGISREGAVFRFDRSVNDGTLKALLDREVISRKYADNSNLVVWSGRTLRFRVEGYQRDLPVLASVYDLSNNYVHAEFTPGKQTCVREAETRSH